MSLLYNDIAHELHLATYEHNLLVRNIPVLREEDPGRYVYLFQPQLCNLDRRSRLACYHVLKQNRFVRITVLGGSVFQPRSHIPLAAEGDMQIGYYETAWPECLCASICIEVMSTRPQANCAQVCLVPLRMLGVFLARLSVLQSTSPPPRLVPVDVATEDRLRYDMVVDVHDVGDSVFQETCIHGLVSAFARFQSDSVRIWTNTHTPFIPVATLEAVVRSDYASLEGWLGLVLNQHTAWINTSVDLLSKSGRQEREFGGSLGCVYPGIADAAQRLFLFLFRTCWETIDAVLRRRLYYSVVASTFNALAVLGLRGFGEDGWEDVLVGGCGTPLCLCTVLGFDEDSLRWSKPLDWDSAGSCEQRVWPYLCHLAAAFHLLPEDVETLGDVDEIRRCIRGLKTIAKPVGGLKPSDGYLTHDITVLRRILEEIEDWLREDNGRVVRDFQPQPLPGEETVFIDISFTFAQRLSVGRYNTSFPLRLVRVAEEGLELHVLGVNDGDPGTIFDCDFS